MVTGITPLKPITKKVGNRVIKRYNAKLIKQHNPTNSNTNIGITPKGSFYYRETMPDKSMSSIYLEKQDGTEVIVDSFTVDSERKCNVIIQKDGKVVDGKYIHQFSNKYNSVADNYYIGYPARAYVSDNVYKAKALLEERVDMSEFRPKKTIFTKIKEALF